MQDSEILKKAISDGIIDIPTICEQLLMSERKKLLAKHTGKIWLASDGRYKTHLPDEKRRLISKPTIKELEDCLVEYYKENSYEPVFEEVFYTWVNRKCEHGEIQMQTKYRYVQVFKKYIKNSNINIKIRDIDEILLEDFVFTTIKENNLTAKGWSSVRTLIRGVFKYSKRMGYTDLSIYQFFGDLDISRKVFRRNRRIDAEQIFTTKEVELLVQRAYDSNRMAELAVALAFQTGLRAGEIVALCWNDVFENYIYVYKTEIRSRDENNKQVYLIRDTPKTENGERRVYITEEAKRTLKKIRAINPFGEYVFMNKDKRLHGQLLGFTCKSMCSKVGILPRSIHKCRKTYATNLINADVDEKLIQSQLGHSDITTTRKYYYYNNISEEEALNQLKRVSNFV